VTAPRQRYRVRWIRKTVWARWWAPWRATTVTWTAIFTPPLKIPPRTMAMFDPIPVPLGDGEPLELDVDVTFLPLEHVRGNGKGA